MSVRTRLKRYPRRLPLWVIPVVYVVVTVICALVLPRLEYFYLPGFTHTVSVGSAVAVLVILSVIGRRGRDTIERCSRP